MSAATVTPPPVGIMTAEEFGLKYAGERAEYVNGQVRETMPGGGKHGKSCSLVAYFLTHFVRTHGLGHVFANDTFVHIPLPKDPERVYGPDVFFVSRDRMPKTEDIPSGTVLALPNLAVEVKSPSDTWSYVFGKVSDYLVVGVTLVLVFDPVGRSATVYGDEFGQRTFGPDDQLTLPEVLPGFSVRVADFFD